MTRFSARISEASNGGSPAKLRKIMQRSTWEIVAIAIFLVVDMIQEIHHLIQANQPAAGEEPI